MILFASPSWSTAAINRIIDSTIASPPTANSSSGCSASAGPISDAEPEGRRRPNARRERRLAAHQPGRGERRARARLYLQPDDSDPLVATDPEPRIETAARTISTESPASTRRRAGGAGRRRRRRRRVRRWCWSSARSTPRARSCVPSAASSRPAACGRGWSTSRRAARRSTATSPRRRSRSTTVAAGRASRADRGVSVGAMAEAFWAGCGDRATSRAIIRRRIGRRLAGRAGHAHAAHRRAEAARLLGRLGRRRDVGAAEITMMYSVTDVQGLNSISRQVLGNGAKRWSAWQGAARTAAKPQATRDLPAVGLTMFGVTTPRCSSIAPRCARSSSVWCFTPPASAAGRWRSWSIPGCSPASSISRRPKSPTC